MLAGAKEALQLRGEGAIEKEMKAIDSLLEGLIDYAGLYPPAGLDMRSAVRNYLNYRQGKQAFVLGRFIVDLSRLVELREIAGPSLREMRLSVIASTTSDWGSLLPLIEDGIPIETVEVKVDKAVDVGRIRGGFPAGAPIYFEASATANYSELFDAISSAGARAKLRLGGIIAEAFPSPQVAASLMAAIAERQIAFKATAGLHHPIRSCHRFTCEPASLSGMMHGFVNLFCAASLLFFDGELKDAQRVLEDEDPTAWSFTKEEIGWCNFKWNSEQVQSVRRSFLTSFGSCSFEEPLRDLETLGWL
jgi:hypothetical protein